MKRMNNAAFAIMAAGLLCIGFLAGAGAYAADRSACDGDIAKFCQDIAPGMISLMECLEKHESELTAACREYETTMGVGKTERRERVKEKTKFRQACLGDMAKFCNDANPTQGGMLKCLSDHDQEISVSCSESVKAMLN